MVSDDVLTQVRQMVAERGWERFHTPATLAKSIVIEAGELLEHFQWDDDVDLGAVALELADVLTYCLLLADRLGRSAEELVLEKLALTRAKYPADTSYGRSGKHGRLPN